MADHPWKPMQIAPKDGTLIDLMYPYPRGRAINCQWKHGSWGFKTPTWKDGELLDPEKWHWNTYPNLQPYAWMTPPPFPGDVK